MANRWRRVPRSPLVPAAAWGCQVSNTAQVVTPGGQVLTQFENRDGYWRVKVAGQWVLVSRLVALAFHGPPEVLHGPAGKQDNSPSNLRWGSRRENERDKVRSRRNVEEGTITNRQVPGASSVTGDVLR
jgi:HNH endonuclease